MKRKGKKDKYTHAAHIKRHTHGTSNEISFSVLDAAKMTLEDGKDSVELPHGKGLGRIPVFTLPGRRSKKVAATPTKEKELLLPGGEPVQTEATSSTPGTVAPTSAVAGAPVPDLTAAAPVAAALPAVSAEPKKAKPREEKPPVSPEMEIARRKAFRRLRRRMAIALVAVMSVALVAVGALFLYNNHETHMGYVNELQAALDNVAQADEVIVGMNEALASPTVRGSLESMSQLQGQISSTRATLNEAKALAASAVDGMQDSSDKEAAGNATVSIDARLTMLDEGEVLMEAALQAAEATEALNAAWAKVLEADTFARDAAQLVTVYTAENVTASRERTLAAIASLEDAQAQLGAIAASYSDINVADQQAYVAKRLEAQQHAVASDDAILAEDIALASAENDAYNAADAEAVALAKSLPDNPADPAADAYEAATADAAKAYESARTQAASADAFLRNYLGLLGK